MQLSKQQVINLVIGLEAIGVSYEMYRHTDGTCTVSVNSNSLCMLGLRRLFEKHNAIAYFNVEATNLTRTVSAMIHDVKYDVICDFDVDNHGGITIHRMMLADELYPLDWSRKIYASVIVELEKVMGGE